MKKKIFSFIKNLFFNFLGYGINAIMLQLLIIPYLSRILDTNTYGIFQTVLSIYQFVPATISLSLNNLRLILNDEEKNINFSFLNVSGSILGVMISFVLLIVTKCHLNLFQILVFVATNILWISSEYFIVEFRKKLEYEKILFYNLTQSIGYLLGGIIAFWAKEPLFVYLLGMLFGYIYTKIATEISKEPIKKNRQYSNVKKDYIVLLTSNGLANVLGVCDRMMIMPLIGSNMVGIYTSAMIFTRLVSLFMSPINGILLSYLSKQKNKNKKMFLYVLMVLVLLGTLGYMVLALGKRFILNLLYPTYADEAIKYAGITIAIAMIQMISSVVGPFVLKHCSLKKQGIFNIFSLLVYMTAAFTLVSQYGIYAICYAMLISVLIKLILYVALYLFSSKEGG